MDVEIDDRNKKIDEFIRKIPQDNICPNILVLLYAKKKLRFNELYRSLRKFGTDISKPTFSDHLNHLMKKGLIKRKVEDAQNVTYRLSNEKIFDSSKDVNEVIGVVERLRRSLEGVGENYFPELKIVDIKKLTGKKLEQQIESDLNMVLKFSLYELKAVVNYELRINERESDTDFWRFIGNPLYRAFERSIVDNCRENDEYKTKFLEKMDFLINTLRIELKE